MDNKKSCSSTILFLSLILVILIAFIVSLLVPQLIDLVQSMISVQYYYSGAISGGKYNAGGNTDLSTSSGDGNWRRTTTKWIRRLLRIDKDSNGAKVFARP